jgi:hypothetical protein
LAGIPSPAGNFSVLTDNANRLAAEFYGSFPGRGVWPDVAACRLMLTDQELPAAKFKPRVWNGAMRLFENRDVLPMARKAGFIRVFGTRGDIWREMENVKADVRNTVWVEDGGMGRWRGLPAPQRELARFGRARGVISSVKERELRGEWEGPSRFLVRWPGEGGGFLIWSESCQPGWRAWVDGRPASIGRAYGLFQTVRVPDNGSKIVEFRYEPTAFRLGLFVSLASLAGFLGLWIIRRKKQGPSW